MNWVSVIDREELREKGAVIARKEGRQLAVFAVEDQVYAIDNRCPHEGYPLKEGTVDGKSCVLTCQWHNWKFDLKSGKNLIGEDNVRTYPVRVTDGQVEVDVSDPSPEQQEAAILEGLMVGFEKRQYGRMTRDVARLVSTGLDATRVVAEVIRRCHDKVEFGTTHAWAAAADWLALYDAAGDDAERRVIAITEILDQFAEDTLREQPYPYTQAVQDFRPEGFLTALEGEDENTAVAMVRGLLRDGMDWEALEPYLVQAGLNHYYDFGHTMIYIQKTGELIRRLGDDLTEVLVLPLIRSICYATREDLLPDFRAYAGFAAEEPSFGASAHIPDSREIYGLRVDKILAWTQAKSRGHKPEAVSEALMAAAARNLLHFDIRFQFAHNNKVKDNIGWLAFTHGLTFANAVRTLCARYPQWWYRGLLQMACFIGRNKPYVTEIDTDAWSVPDTGAFFDRAFEKVTDHGLGRTIFSCHMLKTTTAVLVEMESVSPATASILSAGLNRYLNEPIKEKHVRRLARQALALVSR
ncbi:MAG: nitrite reductase small subunit NirD [Acidobacteriota bacterium]|nr:nitrite reductase small subunit NirD [Acidobacteriota bacterium]